MTIGGRAIRPLELLTADELDDIHSATLHVLMTVGIEFHDKRSLAVLEEAGAKVDHSSCKATFPEELVMDAVRNAPRSVTLCGRTGERDATLDGSRVFFAAGANAIYILEPDGRKVRDATVEDCQKLARLADALDNIHVYLSLASPQDVDPKGVDRLRCAVALQNTTKHLFHDAQGEAGARD
ncbi:MAG: trimethylamine methyltransferase family protein, partial [Nitrososphaeria archaeon]